MEFDTFPSTEHGLMLVGAIFVIFLAARAWTHGVLKMFWAIIGLALGAAAGVLSFQHANAVLPGEELGAGALAGIAVVVGLIAYIVFRQIAKSMLQKLFNDDGPLSGWADGMRGAIFSLIPSILTLFIVATCLRMSGTLMEMRSASRVCHPEASWLTETYPGWPQLTEWRDAAERMPFVLTFCDPIDPISRVSERTLVLLLIACQGQELKAHLAGHDSIGPIVGGALFNQLLADESIAKLITERKHVSLLRHDKIVSAASNEVLDKMTMRVEVRQAIDDFMLSDARQRLLRSYQRPEVPDF